MTRRYLQAYVMAMAAAAGGAVLAQSAPRAAASAAPALVPAPHSDTQLAHDLLRLKQVDALKAQRDAAKAAGGSGGNGDVWQSTLMILQWDDAAKNRAELAREYLAHVSAVLQLPPTQIDGGWALDQAQFILTRLSQPIITRMEYWANNEKDRADLQPLADLADDLLHRAQASVEATMKAAEAKQPFDEKVYTRAYSAAAEVKYYAAWSQYYKAMAMTPAGGGADDPRQKILLDAAAALGEWAVDEPDNGVNFQAYLLRGKIYSEARDPAKAVADFTKATGDKAPGWVQYQARYQTVVANLRAREFRAANAALDALKRSIPKDNVDAHLSIDMLAYRVSWAEAEAKSDEVDRRTGRLEALAILSGIIEKDPRYRELVYEQLAAQIPDNADVSTLLPMQQLALANASSQGQKGDTPESRKQLERAVEAAVAARGNTAATRLEKSEAAYLAGACNAVLGNLPEAARYEVEFAEASPRDPRAKPMVGLALEQIGALRKLAASTTTPAAGAGISSEVRAIALRALTLSIDTFGDTQWRYAQARLLEDDNKVSEATAIYEKIPADDRNYLDARYRLVTLATTHFGELSKASAAETRAAAEQLFAACTSFVDLLDHPPANAPKDVLERDQTYRFDIWIIEAATALDPAVKNSDIAIDRLTKLDAAKDKLTEPQKAAVLRYRIEAYQLAGQSDKALEVVQEYARANGQDAMVVIRSMALSTVEEINQVEPTDPARAKALATYLVRLLEPIIKATAAEGKADAAYEYRLIQADMMTRGGQYAEAQKLALELQAEGEKSGKADIRANIAEARAMFAEAKATADKTEYAKAQDYFGRILGQLAPGSESFWECWLRIVQSMEGRATDNSTAEIKRALGDLHGIYDSKYGGTMYKGEFDRLWLKYGN